MKTNVKEHYLDNAATTKPSEAVVRLITQVLEQDWGNPSSLHRKGQKAQEYVRQARFQIASVLDVPEESIFFTSCATESITTVLKGVCEARKHEGKHILYAEGEHPATRENLKALQAAGYETQMLETDETGRIILSDLEQKIRPDTILVTCLSVNNETGLFQPIEEMGKMIHKKNPNCLFHVDATQSFARYPLYPQNWNIDFVSASAHKINGPKGIGLLYKKRGLYLPALLPGGGQQSGMRSGTENVPYIAGFGEAALEMWKDHAAITSRMMNLKLELWKMLRETIPNVTYNGPKPEEGAAHILNLKCAGVRSEVLLHALEDDGVYISSGSACSSNKPGEKSPALSALGLNARQMDESFRVSLGRYTDEEDILALVQAMKSCVPVLRKFYRR